MDFLNQRVSPKAHPAARVSYATRKSRSPTTVMEGRRVRGGHERHMELLAALC